MAICTFSLIFGVDDENASTVVENMNRIMQGNPDFVNNNVVVYDDTTHGTTTEDGECIADGRDMGIVAFIDEIKDDTTLTSVSEVLHYLHTGETPFEDTPLCETDETDNHKCCHCDSDNCCCDCEHSCD